LSLPPGKISPKILERTVFNYLGSMRKDVILAPSEGEDAAIIRVGDKLVAAHCDPISGAYSNIGWIAVNIATNDIATRGVRPCWVLSCIMLPQGSDEKTFNTICVQMGEAAKKLGVNIIGGHSEITVGLGHPLVVVSSFGVVEGECYITTSGAKAGNKIILTKSVGIEGTAILASDRGKGLAEQFGSAFIEKAKEYFDRLSVVKEALTAFRFGGVSAMHDPTEGGILNGVHEMADAAGLGVRIYEDKITVEPETAKICRFYEIDPLQLISSGALLIAAEPQSADNIVNALCKEHIYADVIGEFNPNTNKRILMKKDDSAEMLPRPVSDHLWLALSR